MKTVIPGREGREKIKHVKNIKIKKKTYIQLLVMKMTISEWKIHWMRL